MKVTTTTVLPLQIKQSFNSLLLTMPCPKFGDDDEDLLNIMAYIEKMLWKKLGNTLAKKLKCENLRQEFKETYEKIRKKKESQTENENASKMSFYMLRNTGGRRLELLFRLKRKARTLSLLGTHHEVSKV